MEVVNILDDHSRLAVASPARRITRGPDVAAIFFHAFAQWGTPAAVLTDNGASSPPNNGALAAPPWRSRSANTLYAHVWNRGKSPAYRVRVEFYWCNRVTGDHPSGRAPVRSAVDRRRLPVHDLPGLTGADGNTYVTPGGHAIVRCSMGRVVRERRTRVPRGPGV